MKKERLGKDTESLRALIVGDGGSLFIKTLDMICDSICRDSEG